jgi:hypothetical protein
MDSNVILCAQAIADALKEHECFMVVCTDGNVRLYDNHGAIRRPAVFTNEDLDGKPNTFSMSP